MFSRVLGIAFIALLQVAGSNASPHELGPRIDVSLKAGVPPDLAKRSFAPPLDSWVIFSPNTNRRIQFRRVQYEHEIGGFVPLPASIYNAAQGLATDIMQGPNPALHGGDDVEVDGVGWSWYWWGEYDNTIGDIENIMDYEVLVVIAGDALQGAFEQDATNCWIGLWDQDTGLMLGTISFGCFEG